MNRELTQGVTFNQVSLATTLRRACRCEGKTGPLGAHWNNPGVDDAGSCQLVPRNTVARVRSWDILIFFKWSQLNLTLDRMHAAMEGKEPRTFSRVFP